MNKKVFAMLLICSSSIIKADNQIDMPIKSSSETPLKIRVIDGRAIVSDTLGGKDIEAKLMQVRNRLDRDIKTLDQSLEKKVADWQGRARLKIDQETLEKEQAEILRQKKERDVKAEAAQEEFTRTFKRELEKFNTEIKETVTEVAKEENWDVVQLKETGEIIYTSPRINATEQVKRKHDAKYKAKKAKETKAKEEAAAAKIGA